MLIAKYLILNLPHSFLIKNKLKPILHYLTKFVFIVEIHKLMSLINKKRFDAVKIYDTFPIFHLGPKLHLITRHQFIPKSFNHSPHNKPI